MLSDNMRDFKRCNVVSLTHCSYVAYVIQFLTLTHARGINFIWIVYAKVHDCIQNGNVGQPHLTIPSMRIFFQFIIYLLNVRCLYL